MVPSAAARMSVSLSQHTQYWLVGRGFYYQNVSFSVVFRKRLKFPAIGVAEAFIMPVLTFEITGEAACPVKHVARSVASE